MYFFIFTKENIEIKFILCAISTIPFNRCENLHSKIHTIAEAKTQSTVLSAYKHFRSSADTNIV